MILEDYSPGCRTTTSNAFSDKTFERTTVTYGSEAQSIPLKRRSPANLRDSNMPVTANPQSLLASLPSFMSVFGDGTNAWREGEDDGIATNPPNRAVGVAKRPSPISHFSSPIFRRDSMSALESADSSPTTTISTVDSSLTEPSPSSSPESPTSVLPLSSLKPLGMSARTTRNIVEQNERFSSSSATLLSLNRADSPNKKMRNTKNLFVNTAASSRQAHLLPRLALSTAAAPANGHPFSAPPTPSFIVPPKPARRRPSTLGLTLSTPDSGATTQFVRNGSNHVPQTPSDPHISTLRYSHAASNVAIFSPTVAPEGGMRLPPFGNPSIPSRLGKSRPPLSIHQSYNDSSCSSPTTVQTLDHLQEESDYELPLSREAKSPAYPQGPVCIYDPFVFLYLEPNDVEASEFDVILNVAREVKNPFSVVTENATPQVENAAMQVSLGPGSTFLAGRESISEPQTAISDKSFRSAFETLPNEGLRRNSSTAQTPNSSPEYVHIPWDHNTNVVDDLLRLCELIDARVQQRKKVLIHCQCGVSRSASLIIAYGLYKNPQLTVQEAYDLVKNRSRWIGPNMNLIYQLSEFRSSILRDPMPGGPGWRNPSPRWNLTDADSTAKLHSGIAASVHRSSQKAPLSAPFQDERSPHSGRTHSSAPHKGPHSIETPTVGDVTPGPSSAPPDMVWSPSTGAVQSSFDAIPVQEKQKAKFVLPPLPKTMDLDMNLQVPWTSLPKAMDIDKKPHFVLPPPPKATNIATNNLFSPPSKRSGPYTRENVPSLPLCEAPPVPAPPANSLPPPQLLPAGFSSLAARRHAPRRLPLRQEPAGFSENQPPPRFGADHIMLDHVPETPSLLSPRAAEFTASPFHRTAAGDLAGSSVFEQALLSPKPQDDDPRSPVQRGEAPITRNIFGML